MYIFCPAVREVIRGLKLETKMNLVRICVFLREEACLSSQVFCIDVEDARVFINILERAAKDTNVVSEVPDICPSLENETQIRSDFTFDLRDAF